MTSMTSRRRVRREYVACCSLLCLVVLLCILRAGLLNSILPHGQDTWPVTHSNTSHSDTYPRIGQLSRPMTLKSTKKIMRASMLYGRGVIKSKSTNATTECDNTIDIVDAIQTHRAYDEKHNYETMLLQRDIHGGVWSKPAWLLTLVLGELAKEEGERREWIM